VITDLKRIEEVVKDAIDQGAQSVEEVHQAIAKLPLKYLVSERKPRFLRNVGGRRFAQYIFEL
jgi:hypothetical protein